MKLISLKMMVLTGLFVWIPVAFGQQGTVMPQAPVRQNMQMQGELKPTFGQGGNPGFFRVDRNGTVREGGPNEAGSDECWGTNQVQGLNGPLMCCPDSVMSELRRKQKLQCLQPGQEPRELTQEEVGGLQFKNGQPVADSTKDCKPIVCDQDCDQQNQPDGFVKPGQRERDRWAMEGGDDDDWDDTPEPGTPAYQQHLRDLREKQRESQQREDAKAREDRINARVNNAIPVRVANSNEERARNNFNAAQESNREASNALEKANEKLGEAYGSGDQKKIDEAQENFNKAGQTALEAAERERQAKEALTRAETAKKEAEAKAKAEAEKKEKDKDKKAMPLPDGIGGNPAKVRARFCAMNPSQCPELNRYQKFGSGKGKGVDTWVVNPKPEDGGGGMPGEDFSDDASQFLCIMQGQPGQGLGNNQGMDAGADRGSFANNEERQGGCPGGGQSEGGGFGGREGQEEAGIDVARRDDCNSGGRGPRLPGDDVINPGDPTFFECPEMGCVNQQRSSITMNNCPDNSIIGRRSRMSCHPYNGPAGAIDPAR